MKTIFVRLSIGVALVSSVASLAACGGDQMDSKTITKAEAVSRNSQYVHQVVREALPPAAKLEDRGPAELGCTAPDGKPDGRHNISASYWVRGLDAASYNHHFDAVKQWWTSHGWKIVNDDRPGDMFVNADNESDGFGMKIQSNDSNEFSMAISSPCVWPNGTPA